VSRRFALPACGLPRVRDCEAVDRDGCTTTPRLIMCRLAPTLSLVLLSHSPTTYLSLYPYARARWGLNCPVYATQPTVEMGRVVCLAEAESWRSECLVEDVLPSTTNGDTEDHEMDGEETAIVETGQSKEKGKTPLRGPFVPTVEEVHEAFDWIKPIRYNQPLHLGGESERPLHPLPAGS
jgi:cleavage and polyadenylation specificity factor subunit 2